jgi:TIR domain
MSVLDDPKSFRTRLLLEIRACERDSPVKPWVGFRSLPVAQAMPQDDLLKQLEILESERRVELKVLRDSGGVQDAVVKLTGLGRKHLEETEAVTDSTRRPVVGTAALNDPSSQGLHQSQMPEHHPRAFVSHSTQDHPFVERFATDLRQNGVDAWYSGWEIKPGDSIRAKIDEGLEGCEYFIIVLSKSSISRPWVHSELDAATVRKLSGKVRKIIPVKIEDCGDLPPTLGSLCWEDFSNQPYEGALKRVLDSIFERDGRPALGQPRPDMVASTTPTKRLPDRRPRVVATDYGVRTGGSKEGVFLLNEGEVAHRVSILPITLDGERSLHFAGDLTILIHDGFLPALVSLGHEHSMNLDSVWRELRETKNIAATFPLTVRYSDFAGKRYKSICELSRDVMKESGFSIKFLTQEVEDEASRGDAV